MSQTFRRLFRNVCATLTAKVLTRALGFVVLVLQINYLGSSDFGLYTAIFALVMILLAFADFGWETVAVREIGKNPSCAPRCLANLLAWETLCAPVIAIGLVAFVWAAGRLSPNFTSEHLRLACIAAVGILFGTLYKAPAGTLIGLQRLDLANYIELTVAFVSSLLTLLAIYLKAGVEAFIWILNFTFLARFLIATAVARRITGGLGWRIEPELWRVFFRQGLLCTAVAGSFVLYSWIDVVMLSLMTSPEETGNYGAVLRLVVPMMLFVEAIGLAVFPELSARYSSTPQLFRLLLNKTIKLMLALGLAVALGLTLFASEIIGILEPEYERSTQTFALLAWRLPFLFVYSIINYAMAAAGRFKELTVINLCAVAANAALNAALIPHYGMNGAAIATVVSHGTVFFFYFGLRRRYFDLRIPFGDLGRIVLALVVMQGGLLALQWAIGQTHNLADLLGRIVLGAALFCAALLLSGFIGEDEKPYLRDVWSRIKERTGIAGKPGR